MLLSLISSIFFSLLINTIHLCIFLHLIEHVLILVLSHELYASPNIYEQGIRLANVIYLHFC